MEEKDSVMVSNDEIKHLGWLSRLELTDDEITRYASQIKQVIRYLDKLDSISLTEIEPLHSKKGFSELRKDHAESFGGDVLDPTKKNKDGFVKGPRMI